MVIFLTGQTFSGGTGATDVLVLTGAPRAADGGGATSEKTRSSSLMR